MKKWISLLLAAVLALTLFGGCGKNETDNPVPAEPDTTDASGAAHSFVLFTMENGGTFKLELYPEYAPKTVENFLKLVSDGFYDGLTFHRVVEGFMAQGGDPTLVGRPTADSIYGEFASNGFTQNTLHHGRGVISMARTTVPDSASSQFFICYADADSLDGNYAAFGEVIEGMETVDGFLDVERTYNGTDTKPATPVTPIVIAHAEVVDA